MIRLFNDIISILAVQTRALVYFAAQILVIRHAAHCSSEEPGLQPRSSLILLTVS